MSKQTAVALLFDYIEANIHEDNFNILAAKEQALRMEKEQMKDAYLTHVTKTERLRKIFEQQFEEYYNETYVGNNE